MNLKKLIEKWNKLPIEIKVSIAAVLIALGMVNLL